MKKTYRILGTMLLIIGLSCDKPCEAISATFTNNSGKDIIAYTYPLLKSSHWSKETKINNNSSISNTWQSCEDFPGDFYSLLQGDSIVIDFGDKTTYFSSRVRNGFTNQKGSNQNVYILTPDDYANATPKP